MNGLLLFFLLPFLFSLHKEYEDLPNLLVPETEEFPVTAGPPHEVPGIPRFHHAPYLTRPLQYIKSYIFRPLGGVLLCCRSA